MAPEDGADKEVGWWAREKYDRITAYVEASHAARRKWLGPGKAGATYIDPFCGYPEGRIRDTGETYESGAIAACRAAARHDTQFTAVHIGDADSEKVNRTLEALEPFGVPVHPYVGQARETIPQICKNLNPYGLHLAFLDPYNIADLELELVQQLGAFKRIDIIAHVSISDLQRNVQNEITQPSRRRIERFAPGWRNHVDLQQSKRRIVEDLLEYWRQLVEESGMSRSDRAPLVCASKRQPLYYLMFLCKDDFPERLWQSIQNLSGRTRDLGL